MARLGDYVLERVCGPMGPGYLFPAGSGALEEALSALEADAVERGVRAASSASHRSRSCCWSRPGRGSTRLEPDRDGWDYLYRVDRLAALTGKKLQAKRNHINRFVERCPDWSTEELTMDNLAECAQMDLEWNRLYRTESGGDSEREAQTRLDERHAMSKAFAYFEKLGMFGLALRTQGRVVAFTMGSLINPGDCGRAF